MIAYIIKMLFCSCILLIIYQLILSKEKFFKFNRFYLLFSLLFSLIIPAINFTIKQSAIPIGEDLQETAANISFQVQNIVPITKQISIKSVEGIIPNFINVLPFVLLSFYCIIGSYLLIIFTKNILILLSDNQNTHIKKSEKITIVLTEKSQIPYSFFNRIFLTKKDYENGTIEEEILHHEMAHVFQKHSFDIIFIELLLVFFWANPFLYLYKKAIVLNHEFLADDYVIGASENIGQYQLLLVNKANTGKSISLSSSFNYITIKKRLLMMSKQKQRNQELIKQIAIVPFMLLLSVLICTKVLAQQLEKIIKLDSLKTPLQTIPIATYIQTNKKNKKIFFWGLSIGSTTNGVSKEMLNEYDNILVKNNLKDENPWKNKTVKIENNDRSKLESIFKQMSEEQQEEQVVGFYKQRPPSKNLPPTIAQFNNFKNPKLYGIWIDDKKVNNSILEKYKVDDFAYFSASKLYGAAKKNVSYSVQVNLMTTNFYYDYLRKRIIDSEKIKIYFKQKKVDKDAKATTYYILHGEN